MTQTAHISFSELKQWVQCPFYHKLVRIDKLGGFRGNEYTAFGTAIHSVCEKKLLHEEMESDFFVKELEKNIAELDDDIDINNKLVADMSHQGNKIIPEIEDGLKEYFGEYEVVAVEQSLMEPFDDQYNFKGFIDAVLKTPDGKYHIVDWKSCSWGWNAKKRSDPMVTYQLTFYKYFYARKLNIDVKDIETHFALLKRTAKSNHVEFFRVTSGPRKTENAIKYIKNRLSCDRCEYRQTEHCP